MNGACEDLPAGEQLLRHQQHFRCAPLVRMGTGRPPRAAMYLAWHLCCCRCGGVGTGLWERLVIGVGMVSFCRLHSWICCKNVLQPFHKSSALWPSSSPLASGTGGTASHRWTLPRAARTLSFVSIYSTRARLMLTLSIFPGTWHIFIEPKLPASLSASWGCTHTCGTAGSACSSISRGWGLCVRQNRAFQITIHCS